MVFRKEMGAEQSSEDVVFSVVRFAPELPLAFLQLSSWSLRRSYFEELLLLKWTLVCSRFDSYRVLRKLVWLFECCQTGWSYYILPHIYLKLTPVLIVFVLELEMA